MPPRRKQPTLAASLAAAPKPGKDVAQAPPARGLAGAVPPAPTPESVEARLREFDLDSKYGPCVAISRRARWERAERLGLNPPRDILSLLDAADPPAKQMSLWYGRV